MFLKNISLSQYKSHSDTKTELGEGVNCITGKNGTGKTNLLDAVYYLLNGKSYFQSVDSLCITQGETYFILKGTLADGESESRLMVSFNTGKRKAIKDNEESFSKLATFFGRYPCVVIAPDDVEIINGEGDQRRRFFDYMLSVVDAPYLKHLTDYNKLLDRRNKLLKLFLENGNFDMVLIQCYDEEMTLNGNYIYKMRQEATAVFESHFKTAYQEIAGGDEVPVFNYLSKLQDLDFRTGFSENLQKDRILGRTSFGIHRDDWQFDLNTMPLKKTGSQGQIKSFLIALKLAMYHFIQEKRTIKPFLLLDDIFEKIDQSRMKQLVDIISAKNMGQVIITDTSRKRVEEYFKGKGKIRVIEL